MGFNSGFKGLNYTYPLSVLENLSCLQDIWLRHNEMKTSRNWEERTEELTRVSKKETKC